MHISDLLPPIRPARSPGPSVALLASSSPPPLTRPESSVAETKGLLRNAWQQRRLGLDARPPLVQGMADQVERWCRNFLANGKTGRVIILAGPYGCAKTKCLNAASTYIRDVRMAAWPEPWGHPPQAMKVNWSDFSHEATEGKNREIVEDLLACDVVLLDDVGAEEDRFKSGADIRLLGDILGKIHDQRKFAFITTNFGPSGWTERWDGRVHDRLLRMDSVIVDMTAALSYAVWRDQQ